MNPIFRARTIHFKARELMRGPPRRKNHIGCRPTKKTRDTPVRTEDLIKFALRTSVNREPAAALQANKKDGARGWDFYFDLNGDFHPNQRPPHADTGGNNANHLQKTGWAPAVSGPPGFFLKPGKNKAPAQSCMRLPRPKQSSLHRILGPALLGWD